MIRLCNEQDVKSIYDIINDAAQAYKGIIPEDRYHEPYMSLEELNEEINNGVLFWGYEVDNEVVGVMGLQEKGDVSLIRHAYVRTNQRNYGLGGKLLVYLVSLTKKPLLIGTWESAFWAIGFYEKYGFQVVSNESKEELLRKYWNVPDKQIQTSVVLTNEVRYI
ncbi:GNAT family N-acetyltransferase [Paenibacillus sp. FA6]|uniref:GNAT family N-acetyltransferase n=1 Tax=Paenibacillus sp. FA6 TaxID=3413029 RepID=UPI003F65C2E8